MATAEDYKNDYLSLATDINNVKNIGYFDDLRREATKARYEAAKIVKDPAAMYEELAKVFSQIKQDIAYFAGKDPAVKPTRTNDLEERIRIGLRAIDEKL